MQLTFVGDFKINKMTKAQYSGIVPSQTEVYITTDEADAVLSVNGILPNAQGNVTLSIPAAVTESTVADWGFTKNVGTVTSVNGVSPTNGNVALSVVDKTGDTMTGNLTIENSDIPFVSLVNTSLSLDELPEATKYSYIRMIDTNGNLVSGFYSRYGTDGNISSRISCANRDHTDSVYLALGFDADGNGYCAFPRCTTVPTTTSTAKSNLYAVIIKNYLNGDSWYRKWSDGFIEQGGKVSHTSATQTINLLQNFTTTNYNIQTTLEDSTGNRYTVQVVNSNKTTSSFQVYCGHTTNNYYWRACGY